MSGVRERGENHVNSVKSLVIRVTFGAGRGIHGGPGDSWPIRKGLDVSPSLLIPYGGKVIRGGRTHHIEDDLNLIEV